MAGGGLFQGAEAGSDDFRVVEAEDIAGAEEGGEIAKIAVLQGVGVTAEMEEPGGVALCSRVLCNQLRGEIEMEVGPGHRIGGGEWWRSTRNWKRSVNKL